MNVLVIGGGGREHALAWRLRQAPSVNELHQIATSKDYLQLAESLNIDLTVVGPEAPLVAGVVDQFRSHGRNIIGPTSVNAALEGSKIHSKQMMERLGVPTARFLTANSIEEAKAALPKFRLPVVLKTDGLAAGKGVIIATSHAEAEAGLQSLAYPLVMEEFLEGEELSFIVLCDGKTGVPLEPSQDHKRIFDNDEGPNTGGMGAYSDSRMLDAKTRSNIMETVINPVIRATGFTGFLYAGLMMTPDGPRVLEFNVRLGDPETQPLMMRLTSDFAEALMATACGQLREEHLQWSPDPAACIVLASGGYPGTCESGKPIKGLDDVRDAVVFHAGTKKVGGQFLTAGGRVLGVTATGATLKQSLDRAYAAVDRIHFAGMQYRKDIGARGLKRYTE